MTLTRLVAAIFMVFSTLGIIASGQESKTIESEKAAINALYRDWSQATATRGADGYASYFVEDGAVLPPNESAAEGRNAIRDWVKKSLEQFTIKDPRLTFGELRIANGWAMRRFQMTGERLPRVGGPVIKFNNKYLDVLQKQSDGTWRFVYRAYSSNE